MTADIRTTRPYFRFKRGTLTLLIETRATAKISNVKTQLLNALQAHDEDNLFAVLNTSNIKLLVQQADADSQYRPLADTTKVSDCGLADDDAIYFVLQKDDGSWEDPHAADYDTDAQDVDMSY
ncbi:hypothetical protein EV176_002296 [Coemansia sp. RSA 451]|nr:hypothetical protein EV176_002296 [Coemansia sp. RSA 451]